MSDHVSRVSPDEELTAGSSSRVHQSNWMSRWVKSTPKPSLYSYRDEHVDQNICLAKNKLIMERDLLNRTISKPDKSMGVQEKTENASLSTLCLGQNAENSSTLRTQIGDHQHNYENITLALSADREHTTNNLRANMKHNSNSYNEQNDNAISRSNESNKRGSTSCIPFGQSNHADASSGPVVVFGRQFSNDNFMCLDQGHRKYQNFSTFLFHEKKTNNHHRHESPCCDAPCTQVDSPMNKNNFLPFFLKKQSGILSNNDNRNLYQGFKPVDGIPCSVHDVETMRVSTMVDSVENSSVGHPKVSQRAHHILFTKETCVNLPKECEAFRERVLSANCEAKKFGGSFSSSPDTDSSHPQGLKIQPLWSTTVSSGKEHTGTHLTTKVDLSNDSSIEPDDMQTQAPKNKHIPLGMASSSLRKDDVVNESISPDGFDSTSERTRNKKAITEIPDINEEFPGLQPAGSSTDCIEPSTSRVVVDPKSLFPCDEQTSMSEFNVRQDGRDLHETSSRWIKRLKVSSGDSFGVGTKSSEMEEASSHKKFSAFFNKITKCNPTSLDSMSNNHGTQQMPLDQNLESQRNSGSSSMGLEKRNKSLMPGCSWIQRWRQHPTTTPPLENPEPLVTCEPQKSRALVDEFGKKQFPSIAAIALMGKSVNGGFPPCKFRKRGSVVVWNTQDY